ncbi:hypothetical protein BpHYR1_032013 [Brachionus plicatilis]|uniref:Uncharacterized protein n=1 Tax=Brachionus plicatilis TaxID=10195 RepID=A0A3M7T1S7_BRAPC|nr:hypothetical protein BpHYR1_032013 [Brachionus plicatilis]
MFTAVFKRSWVSQPVKNKSQLTLNRLVFVNFIRILHPIRILGMMQIDCFCVFFLKKNSKYSQKQSRQNNKLDIFTRNYSIDLPINLITTNMTMVKKGNVIKLLSQTNNGRGNILFIKIYIITSQYSLTPNPKTQLKTQFNEKNISINQEFYFVEIKIETILRIPRRDRL